MLTCRTTSSKCCWWYILTYIVHLSILIKIYSPLSLQISQMVANVSNRYENLKKQIKTKRMGMEHTVKLTIFSSKKKFFPWVNPSLVSWQLVENLWNKLMAPKTDQFTHKNESDRENCASLHAFHLLIAKVGFIYRLRWTCFCTKTNSNCKLHLKFDFRHLCTKMTFITWSHPGHLSSGWLIVVWNTRSLMESQIGCIKVCDCHYHFFISQKDSWI